MTPLCLSEPTYPIDIECMHFARINHMALNIRHFIEELIGKKIFKFSTNKQNFSFTLNKIMNISNYLYLLILVY
jgi:hypothetical protein